MSVTLGFAMRIGDFPPAVILPPSPLPFAAAPAAIEAQVVSESSAASTSNQYVGGSFGGRGFAGTQGQYYFRSHATIYTSHGRHGAPSESSGFNLDLFA